MRERAAPGGPAAGSARPARRPRGGRRLARRGRERRRPREDVAPRAEPAAEPDVELHGFDPDHHIHAVPTNGEMKSSRAVELFNASEHPRTVAGVARSLGAPGVTVRPGDADSIVG